MHRNFKGLLAGTLCLALGVATPAWADKAGVAERDAALAKIGLTGAPLPYSVLTNNIPDASRPGKMIELRNGGFGSDMAPHPTIANQFYALTDRGPNADHEGLQGKGKYFPTPDYTPRIGLFELKSDGSAVLVKTILLRRPDGTPITGLPNPKGLGGTSEVPYLADGSPVLVHQDKPFNDDKSSPEYNPLRLDDYGLDSEGLVALSDGSFWVSDEYGPHIVHYDADGKEIGRINPFAKDERASIKLPAELGKRWANRGMEGLAITPDESTLVGLMQSTLYNPDKSVQKQTATRIVTVDLKSGKVAQYLYKQEKPQNANSGIAALSATQFLLIERDGAFAGKKPEAMKHLYRIDLSTGTDLEGVTAAGTSQDEALGLLIDGKTVEQTVQDSGWEALAAMGITPVEKTLVADLVKLNGYPHDKLEGLWIVDDNTVAVINDDDFALWLDEKGMEQKMLSDEKTDGNTLYVIKAPLKGN
ncbi:esterase-like activity of phytase family protein [Megalodesulfovibrio paquesii]